MQARRHNLARPHPPSRPVRPHQEAADGSVRSEACHRRRTAIRCSRCPTAPSSSSTHLEAISAYGFNDCGIVFGFRVEDI